MASVGDSTIRGVKDLPLVAGAGRFLSASWKITFLATAFWAVTAAAEPRSSRSVRPEFVRSTSFYANAVDCAVTYDSGLARRYDDGYDPAAFRPFETALDLYGRWIDDATFGRIWVPRSEIVGPDFAPYVTNGRWLLTEYGWTWISNWDWGWAPFHYGRWIFLTGPGWSWVPGRLWGPAWVAWRRGRDYVAWAPLPPRGIDLPRLFSEGRPWHFARAGTPELTALVLTPHEAFTIFGKLIARVQDRTVAMQEISILTNAGPTHTRGANALTPVTLEAAAPAALPRVTIVPRPGIPVEQRPWVASSR